MRASQVFGAVLATAVMASLTGCGTADSDWNKAVAKNTEAAYQTFLTAHPGDPRAIDAEARLAALQDDQAWSVATAPGAADGYQRYLQLWPDGKHSQQARNGLALELEATQWQSAQADGSAVALQEFLRNYPSGAEAAQARAKLSALSSFRAELASEPTQVKAEKRLAQLQRRFSAKVPALYVIPPSTQGGRYAIASTGMSQTEAQQTCDSLKSARQFCEVISGNTAS